MAIEKLDKMNEVLRQPEPAGEQRMIDTSDLFLGRSEILIRHEGAIYRMKITRQGKLILNK